VLNRHEIEAIYHHGVDAVSDLVEQLFRLIQTQQSQIQEQGLLITSLTARVEELEQSLKQNSGNSHKPPSSDQFNKQTRSLRERAGRQSGGQSEHTGSNLKQVATPDKVIVHVPALPAIFPVWILAHSGDEKTSASDDNTPSHTFVILRRVSLPATGRNLVQAAPNRISVAFVVRSNARSGRVECGAECWLSSRLPGSFGNCNPPCRLRSGIDVWRLG